MKWRKAAAEPRIERAGEWLFQAHARRERFAPLPPELAPRDLGEAYAIQGGNALFMDDANVPSLMSLPYLGCITGADPAYVRSRRLVLSEDNPWFFRGKAAEGVGGPHVGPRMIWPLGITMRALTSTNDVEVLACLRALKASHAGTGFMHEAFDQDDPSRYTRKWFAWANTLFGELVLRVRAERPHRLRASL